jgi:hypothetical protein
MVVVVVLHITMEQEMVDRVVEVLKTQLIMQEQQVTLLLQVQFRVMQVEQGMDQVLPLQGLEVVEQVLLVETEQQVLQAQDRVVLVV